MASRIVEYRIISVYKDTELAALAENVNKAIGAGWEPLGGLCTSQVGYGDPSFYQVVVKKEEVAVSN